MKIIGLTGSIATGKSTAARIFKNLKVPVFDSDREVHKMLRLNGDAFDQIINNFGKIIDNYGNIDRQELGKIVFFDKSKKILLENIIHPKIQKKKEKFIKKYRILNKKKVVMDIQLIFETNSEKKFDKIVVVWAPNRILKTRALRRENMSLKKLDAILESQTPQNYKILKADLSLPTSLGIFETRKRIIRWMKKEFLI